MLVAIDGPAGAGKSTVARALARELGFGYLDSGAMYRCVALAALRSGHGTLPERPGALGELARAATIELGGTGAQATPDGSKTPGASGRSRAPDAHDRSRAQVTSGVVVTVRLDGHDVTREIRMPEVSAAASTVAAEPDVRAALVVKQRQLIARGDWVAEGRDIGTVVAPDAELKVFLTADPRERARRRAAELGADVEQVLAEQTLRDQRDSTREHSPLEPAPGSITLDTSGLSVEQVVGQIARLARG
ncbi:MAG TPA: (d)CMP kinase [Solirubrobacteraceae bacterium]|nr:(d)CMP kinase [Solirubrobacteraceae bacterium]